MLRQMQVWYRRAVTPEHKGVGFGASLLCSVVVSCPQDVSLHHPAHQLLCLHGGNATAHRCVPKQTSSLSLPTEVILRTCHLPRSCLPVFSPGVGHRPQVSIPAILGTCETPGFEPHCLQKLTKFTPSRCGVSAFGETFLCLPLSVPLSHPSL